MRASWLLTSTVVFTLGGIAGGESVRPLGLLVLALVPPPSGTYLVLGGAGFVSGATVGLGQAMVLRRSLGWRRQCYWVLATGVCWFGAALAVSWLGDQMQLADRTAGDFAPIGPGERLLADSVRAALVGTVVGTGQGLILAAGVRRGQLTLILRWMICVACGWLAGPLVGELLATALGPLSFAGAGQWGFFTAVVAGRSAAQGLVVGLATQWYLEQSDSRRHVASAAE